MHHLHNTVGRFMMAAVIAACCGGVSRAQETIIISEDSSLPSDAILTTTPAAGRGSGCQDCSRPPWHGNVADDCCPCDPFESSRATAWFTRLQGLFGDGYLPYPLPPCTPRCNTCGTVIEGGF